MTSRFPLAPLLLGALLLVLAAPSRAALLDARPADASLRGAAVPMSRDTDTGQVRFVGFARLSGVTGSGDSATAVYQGQVFELGGRQSTNRFTGFAGIVSSRTQFVYEVDADGSESLAFSRRWRWERATSSSEAMTPRGIVESALRQALLDALDPSGFPPRRLQTLAFFLPRGTGTGLTPPGTGPLLPASTPVVPTAVPTPAAGGMLVAGLATLGLFGRRSRRR